MSRTKPKPIEGHEEHCYLRDDGTIACVYWCAVGGLMKPLRKCVETLERIGGAPGADAARIGREALERWDRRDGG
jgi:hypothetical protein